MDAKKEPAMLINSEEIPSEKIEGIIVISMKLIP